MKLSILLFVLCTAQIFAQNILYSGEKYTLYDDGVVEGEKEARVLSPAKIQSNYIEALTDGFDRLVKFKFAINGADNERPSGMDHEVYLNPSDGIFETPLFKFGKADPVGSGLPQGKEHEIIPGEDITVIFRLDMREVLSSLEQNGYYLFYTGDTLYQENFEGVYIAGGSAPLIWDFNELSSSEKFRMSDDNSDGIYEIKIKFTPTSYREVRKDVGTWELNYAPNGFPKFTCDIPVVEAMYNLSLEEMLENVRPDGAFMAGAKWNGVWTRDISYSILLSLASVMPDASKASLMAKVKDGRIIQDTGTGGSYPVSSDRMTWVLAAFEIYKATGDIHWLKQIYPIIKKSVEQDLVTLYNEDIKLASGESSFLDWREQSYPEWMDPKDIFISKNLGTNIVHYATLDILAKISGILGYEQEPYLSQSKELKAAINEYLWIDNAGYYGQFLYGRNYLSLSPRSETLGEALAILTGVADDDKSRKIISNTPVTPYGATCFYPQIPDIPPYHNNGIWPFVAAYHTWASSKVKNEKGVLQGISSIYRPALLYLTNKENFVAENGDFKGTQINSNRQLWSVAGNIAMVYRVLLGIEFNKNGMEISPFIPEVFGGDYSLEGIKYGAATVNISVSGFGSNAKEIWVNGQQSESAVIPFGAKGVYNIKIVMDGKIAKSELNLVPNRFSPKTPEVSLSGDKLSWKKVQSAKEFAILLNGKEIDRTNKNEYDIESSSKLDSWQVKAVGNDGLESFLSEPITVINEKSVKIIDVGSVHISAEKNTALSFNIPIDEAGTYAIDLYYGNGTGPINTDNNCAIRTVSTDGRTKIVVMPQRGTNNWESRGYSNPVHFDFKPGEHVLTINFDVSNTNMDGEINEAILEHLRITQLK